MLLLLLLLVMLLLLMLLLLVLLHLHSKGTWRCHWRGVARGLVTVLHV